MLERVRQALGRLTYDFKIAHDGVLGLPIGKEACFASHGIFNDVLDGISNLQKLDAVVLHKGTASA